MKNINRIKFITLFLFFAALVLLANIYDFDLRRILNDLELASTSHPITTALLFILIYTLLKLAFVPMSSVTILSGYMFGSLAGLIVSVAAVTLSSTLFFVIGRYLGRSYIENIIEERFSWLNKYNDKLKEHALLTVLFLRIVPILPLAVVNLGLSFSKISFRDYIIATILGVLPGTFLLVNAGKYLKDLDEPRLYIYGGAYLLLIITTFAIAIIHKKNEQ